MVNCPCKSLSLGWSVTKLQITEAVLNLQVVQSREKTDKEASNPATVPGGGLYRTGGAYRRGKASSGGKARVPEKGRSLESQT